MSSGYRPSLWPRAALGLFLLLFTGGIVTGIILAEPLDRYPSPRLALADLDGTYVSGDCPSITITNGLMRGGGFAVRGELDYVKGENLLVTEGALRFRETPSGCALERVSGGWFNTVSRIDGAPAVRIRSSDFAEDRWFIESR
ncbi:hypothetical protein Ga0102493_11485 [Erythrobacter litoralis]|jgi:hypothetical protein|uniref:Uncharacterized protein n=1 Tax=Erythrobacter litoralis TaxID=39960 RepID=A0A074M7F3_9SPHN|nr:hypothetical protein Ga0102493_11485 [Erythrobacter litoralis]KEO89349.1 hypothetical protein EH32_04265 [Erythrobacter litoralis]